MSLYQVSAGDRILAADLNQFYNILKGVAASGEAVTLIYNAAGVLVLQPSTDPAAGTQLYQIKNTAGTLRSALTNDGGAVYSARVHLAKGADIASAAALTPGVDGNYFHVTGTTTVTSIATAQAGSVVFVEFDGAVLITHNATSLILRSGANVTTAAGDVFAFVSEGSGNWREVGRLTAASLGIQSTITNSLSGDVTMTNANTYYDGPSIAQGTTGTWWVSGTVTLQDTSGAAGYTTVKLWDGTTVIASGSVEMGNAANTPGQGAVALSGRIASPAGNLRMSCASQNAGVKIIATISQNGAGATASTITAMRIA